MIASCYQARGCLLPVRGVYKVYTPFSPHVLKREFVNLGVPWSRWHLPRVLFLLGPLLSVWTDTQISLFRTCPLERALYTTVNEGFGGMGPRMPPLKVHQKALIKCNARWLNKCDPRIIIVKERIKGGMYAYHVVLAS